MDKMNTRKGWGGGGKGLVTHPFSTCARMCIICHIVLSIPPPPPPQKKKKGKVKGRLR